MGRVADLPNVQGVSPELLLVMQEQVRVSMQLARAQAGKAEIARIAADRQVEEATREARKPETQRQRAK